MKKSNYFNFTSVISRMFSLLLLTGMWITNANAQVASSYTFAGSSGTYTAISTGTVLGTATNDENTFTANAIGFSFVYNGSTFTTFSVSANGYISLGNTITATRLGPISATGTDQRISGLGLDLIGISAVSELRFLSTGSSPNKTLTVQWKNYNRAIAPGTGASPIDVINFQIILTETSNSVKVVYGTVTSSNASGANTNSQYQVGLRGAVNTDFNNRSVVSGSSTWAASTAGTLNSSSCVIVGSGSTVLPASGQTFTWTSSCFVPVYKTLPATESFETAWLSCYSTTDAPNASWKNNTPATGNNSWRRNDAGASASWTSPASGVYSPVFSAGSFSARFHSYNASGGTQGSLDLYVNLSPAGTKNIIFDYINTDGTDALAVFLSTDGGVTFPTQLGSNFLSVGSWTTAIVTTTSTLATAVIRFRAQSDFGNTDIGLDNISIAVQCTNSTQFPAASFAAPASGATTTISNTQTQSQYNQMTGAVAGSNFTSTASIAGTYITIRATTFNGTVVANGVTPLTWTAASGGTYFIHYNTNPSCGTAATNMTSSITRNVVACPANTTQYPFSSFVAPAPGATYQIITDQYNGGEYNAMTGATAGHTFTSSSPSVSTTYITVRAGTSGGSVVASGLTPLAWTATAGGNYFIHYYSSAYPTCGAPLTGSMTTTIQNTTAVAAPGNDACANATTLPCASGVINGTTVNCVSETSPGCGNNYGVWYKFTGDGQSTTITSTTTMDHSLGIYSATGACTGLSLVKCDDDVAGTESHTFTTINGTQYYIYVAYYLSGSTTTGTFTMSRTCVAGGFNPCTSIGAISSCGVSTNNVIAAGTGAYNPVSSQCGTFTTPGQEKLYTFTPSTTGNYQISQTASTGYIDYFFKASSGGCSGTGWTCIDDISGNNVSNDLINLSLTGGIEYYIMLDPEDAIAQTVTFSIVCATCSTVLTSDAATSTSTYPTNYSATLAATSFPSAIALAPRGTNHDLAIYNSSCQTGGVSATSTINSGSTVDFVAYGYGNTGTKYPSAETAGSGASVIEFQQVSTIMSIGTTYSATIGISEALDLFETNALTAGVSYNIKLTVSSGNCNLGFAVVYEGTSGTSILSRTSASVVVDANGAGLSESVCNFIAPSDGYYVIVIFNNQSPAPTVASNYSIVYELASNTMTSANSASICSGGLVTIPLTSVKPSTFTWIAADNTNTTGESTTMQSTSTLSNTITNNVVSAQIDVYTVVPTSTSTGCTGTPQTVNVDVKPGFSGGTLSSAGKTICENSSPSNITFSTAPSGGTTPSFQWYKQAGTPACPSGAFSLGSWTAVGGPSASPNLSSAAIGSVTGTTRFALAMTDVGTPSCYSATWTGSCHTITVAANPTANITSSNTSICTGGSANITGTVTSSSATWTVYLTDDPTGSMPSYSETGTGTTFSIPVSPVTAGTHTYQIIQLDNDDALGCSAVGGGLTGSTDVTVYAAVPAQPAAISGAPAAMCSFPQTLTLSIPSVPNAESYLWYPGPGSLGMTFENPPFDGLTQDITFNSTPNSTFNVRVDAINACGPSTPPRSVSIRTQVSGVASLTGPTQACPGDINKIYTASAVTGATDYTWTGPSGILFDGNPSPYTANDLSVNATYPGVFTGGTICITANLLTCYSSPPQCLTVTAAPEKPSGITGTFSLCPGTQDVDYSVVNVPGLTYTWTAPANSVIDPTGPGGANGTNTIRIDYNANFVSGDIQVYATGPCGTSPVRSKTVSRGSGGQMVAQPNNISGPINALCGAANVTYTALPVNGSATYNWTFPTGTTFNGSPNANPVSVTFPASIPATPAQTISVTAQISCVTSSPRVITIKGAPGKATVSGPSTVCSNSTGNVFSVPAYAGPVTYTWYVPTGASITNGAGTNSITVTWGSVSGTVTLLASNVCGNATSSKSVVDDCRLSPASADAASLMLFNAYPNPASTTVNVEFKVEKGQQYVVRMLDLSGRILFTARNVSDGETTLERFDVSTLAKGVYVLTVETGDDIVRARIVVE